MNCGVVFYCLICDFFNGFFVEIVVKCVEIIGQYAVTKQNTESNMLNRISVGLLLNPSITKTEQGYYLYSTSGDGKKCFHSGCVFIWFLSS